MLPYEFGKELTAFSLVAGRLILFVIVVYVSQKCYYESCEQEQQFPCNEHRHHLPTLFREGKKNLRSRLSEATATVYGALRVFDNTAVIVSQSMHLVNRITENMHPLSSPLPRLVGGDFDEVFCTCATASRYLLQVGQSRQIRIPHRLCQVGGNFDEIRSACDPKL